jgi:nitrate/nitrite transport system substrate-binding protein
MHNYPLRYCLAENGVDPDQDLQIAAVPPPQMVAKMKAGELDGFLAPDPMNQRGVYDGIPGKFGTGTHALRHYRGACCHAAQRGESSA